MKDNVIANWQPTNAFGKTSKPRKENDITLSAKKIIRSYSKPFARGSINVNVYEEVCRHCGKTFEFHCATVNNQMRCTHCKKRQTK